MLTNNAKAVAMQVGQWLSNTSTGVFPVTTRTGATRYLTAQDTMLKSSLSLLLGTWETDTNSDLRVAVGEGNTTATTNDYDLDDQITSGLTLIGTTRTNTIDANNNPVATVELTIRNTSDVSKTIREVGWFGRCETVNALGTTGGTSSLYLLLLDRTVLTTPLTIASGETGLLKYALTANWNS